MAEDSKRQKIILSIIGIIPVIWLSLLIAPYLDGGLAEIIKNFSKALNNPFSITICNNTIKTVFFFIACLWISNRNIFFYKKKLS